MIALREDSFTRNISGPRPVVRTWGGIVPPEIPAYQKREQNHSSTESPSTE